MTNKQDIVVHRIAKCKRSLKDTELLIKDRSYLAAINRMYYALFYVVTAYLLIHDVIVKSHNGVKTKFHQELTLKHLVTREESKLYELLYMKRHESDYDDFIVINADEVSDIFSRVKLLIGKIEILINVEDTF